MKPTIITSKWNIYHIENSNLNKAGWPNGKALDYESRDCRFDPCVGQYLFPFFLFNLFFFFFTFWNVGGGWFVVAST